MIRTSTVLLLALWGLFGARTAHAFDQFHGAKPVPRLNYDSLFADAATISETPAGQALIQGCIERYGGTSQLAKPRSFRLTYHMKAFLNRDSITVTKSFRSGRQYRIHRRGPATNEIRTLNRDQSWYANTDTIMALDGGRYKAELFSYLTLAMPAAIETEHFDAIRYGRRDADSLEYVYMVKNDSLMIVLGIDPDDHLIKSSEGIIRQGNESFVFINRFADHRDHDGYVIPHSLTNISMGLKVAESRIVDIVIDPEFREDEFIPKQPIDLKTVY